MSYSCTYLPIAACCSVSRPLLHGGRTLPGEGVVADQGVADTRISHLTLLGEQINQFQLAIYFL